ncbi:MAG: DUF815 domain-containing protein [Candidatus Altiarchaeota archaeon]|nr:DUF815 domain-containing protein [Candidatus Altiarchaeota archaeon]
MSSSQEQLELLETMYTLTNDFRKTLSTLSPGMRSVISGDYETKETGSVLPIFLEDFYDSLKDLISVSFEDGNSIEDRWAWQAYQELLDTKSGNEELYILNSKKVGKIIKKGRKLQKTFGKSGPPNIASAQERDAIRDGFLEHLSVLEDAFNSKFVYAYTLFKKVLDGDAPNKKKVKLLGDLEETMTALRTHEAFQGTPKNVYELEYTFGTRDQIKSQTEKYLSAEIDWDTYSDNLSLDDKIITVEVTNEGMKITPVDVDTFPDWEDFGGYTTVVEGIESWVDKIQKGNPHLKRVLLAGVAGTGKTTLLRVALKELAKNGFTPIYLTRMEGSNLGSLNSFVRAVTKYLPDGQRVVAAMDDIESSLVTGLSDRNESLRQIEAFPYPLITTVNPDLPMHGTQESTGGLKDIASLRRFNAHFYFGCPEKEERTEIVEIIAKNLEYELTPEDIIDIVACGEKQPGAYMELLIERKMLYPTWTWQRISDDLSKHMQAIMNPTLKSRNDTKSEYS